RRLFLQAGWTMGNTFAEWNTKLSSDRYINGVGISAGYNSVIGPVSLTFMTSGRHDFLTYFSAGYSF
ncbi:MAG: hypothetical protein P8181_17190, partial [bacterium]